MSPPPTTTRWCPTPEQLMILEEMYRGGMRTPSAALIQKITAHLSNYGKVQGKNVFYWFQNHKARDRQRLRRKFSKQLHLHFNPHHHLLHYYLPPTISPVFPLQHLTFYNAASFLPHPQVSLRGGHSNVEEEASSVMNNNHGNDHDNQTVEMRRSEQKQADLRMMTITEIPCCATTRPTKTLELFPLTATNMKEECK